jgi:hypothetical protein
VGTYIVAIPFFLIAFYASPEIFSRKGNLVNKWWDDGIAAAALRSKTERILTVTESGFRCTRSPPIVY